MKRVFLIPVAVLVLAGVATGAYFWVSAEGTADEAPLAQQEGTPTPTPEPTSTPEFTPTTTPSLLPQPSPQPIPDDWLTYTDPEIGVTVRYPPDWVAERRDFPAHPEVPGDVDTYRVDIYKPLFDGVSGKTDAAGTDRSAVVHIWTGKSRNFLEWWTDQCQPAPTTLGGLAADRCVWTYRHNPHPSMMAPPEGAYVFYTVHGADGPRYVGAVLYLFDASGNPADRWAATSQIAAEQIMASIAVTADGSP